MTGELHDATHDDMWELIRRIREGLDEAAGDLSSRELVLFRVLKIGEEFGEVAEALHGVNGTNPRKGKSHTTEDVVKELVDVAVTTFVALETVTPDARKVFEERLQHLVDRPSRPAVDPA
ncbi:MazG-like family protein [Streptomyces sp. NPDC055103]